MVLETRLASIIGETSVCGILSDRGRHRHGGDSGNRLIILLLQFKLANISNSYLVYFTIITLLLDVYVMH